MKHRIPDSTSARARQTVPRGLAPGALAVACALALAGPAAVGADRRSAIKPNPQAVAAAQSSASQKPTPEPEHRWLGERLSDLTVRNWRWFMSIPLAASPFSEDGGVNCGVNQEGPVWFLGGPLGSAYTRTCKVPYGKAILSPIIDIINDYPCPDPNFKPAPGQSMEAFLRAGAVGAIDAVTLAEATFDGVPLRARRVASKLFGFTAAADLNPGFDPCATGSPQLAVSDGYFVFIEPPSRGDHVLHIRSDYPGIGISEGTINLKVE